uniref:Uncharacterized protein n=1 Tax=Corethron hystrix TaxID=216773 RepID=A0A7S1BUI1_9STRA|mmetsp:Transcript_39899/g.93652  ORF Transcript_39899/g.93652 Transcript_39899/m.93652 type:complete len:557 (+) Transcript_39899:166-1836(+)|eukprot:CAMPEP_0113308744 /NCGR_PEP_ID=MMETSP0010_2-20120614/7070_1 /TAXON_ID=216773 ORGANISM="Corethron hystrix, Strain 308" /NCGR_SAMPLE_ID=MMETSP0010_2 /ASSEMBLY_ACC=CAM_ASM_000155 /LENGTH=556 /DNA_ID=CAMNT_0000163867 /DNA_START=141 /DNA_END=1811 /DNA_ORIENTATION=+ /assembly_acc=CAM_ASM_000155
MKKTAPQRYEPGSDGYVSEYSGGSCEIIFAEDDGDNKYEPVILTGPSEAQHHRKSLVWSRSQQRGAIAAQIGNSYDGSEDMEGAEEDQLEKKEEKLEEEEKEIEGVAWEGTVASVSEWESTWGNGRENEDAAINIEMLPEPKNCWETKKIEKEKDEKEETRSGTRGISTEYLSHDTSSAKVASVNTLPQPIEQDEAIKKTMSRRHNEGIPASLFHPRYFGTERAKGRRRSSLPPSPPPPPAKRAKPTITRTADALNAHQRRNQMLFTGNRALGAAASPSIEIARRLADATRERVGGAMFSARRPRMPLPPLMPLPLSPALAPTPMWGSPRPFDIGRVSFRAFRAPCTTPARSLHCNDPFTPPAFLVAQGGRTSRRSISNCTFAGQLTRELAEVRSHVSGVTTKMRPKRYPFRVDTSRRYPQDSPEASDSHLDVTLFRNNETISTTVEREGHWNETGRLTAYKAYVHKEARTGVNADEFQGKGYRAWITFRPETICGGLVSPGSDLRIYGCLILPVQKMKENDHFHYSTLRISWPVIICTEVSEAYPASLTVLPKVN